MNKQIYFALWAEDINQYLSCGFNSQSLSSIKESLLDYVSQDHDNPKNINELEISSLVGMTGLMLDFDYKPFNYRSNYPQDIPTNIRAGFPVNKAYLS
jgi:hypothetical protein